MAAKRRSKGTAKKTAKRRKPKRSTPKKKKSVKRQPPGKGGTQLPAGAHPGNTGGKKGRSGRIPNELKTSAQDVAFLHVFPRLERYLKSKAKGRGPGDAGWRWAAATILDRGFGKVPQPITGDDEGDPIGVRVEREAAALSRILGSLARLAKRAKKK